MNREEFMDIVKEKIEKEPIYDVNKDFITQKYKEAKNGIYFLYDQDGIVIYVGMTGNGETASFYSRMYKNGNSAHCNKPWFSEVKKFRFKSFSKLDKEELILIERLMIYKNNQPRYNDNLMIKNDYEIIVNDKIKMYEKWKIKMYKIVHKSGIILNGRDARYDEYNSTIKYNKNYGN